MSISRELKNKIKNNALELNSDDFDFLKSLYQNESKTFILQIKECVSRIKRKKDIEKFIYLYENLRIEINDIAPFLTRSINAIFNLMISNNFFKKLAEYSDLMEICGNLDFLRILKDLISFRTDLTRHMTTLELYNYKRVIYRLSEKFNERDELVTRIELELASADLEWKDDIE